MPSNGEPDEIEGGLLANDHLTDDNDTESTEQKKTLSDLKVQVLALSLAIFTQGYLLLSCFPYVAFMCIFLVPGLNEQNAGVYAGTISSMFMVGRAISSYAWSKIADKYGRKKVYFWSYVLSMVFTTAFGLSTSITMAIIVRLCMGASNGLVSVTKTVCSEISDGDKELESQIMGIVFGMRGWSQLISPGIGGILSDPLKQFPDSLISTSFSKFFTAYPYFLPNLAGVLFCILGLILTLLYVPETRPSEIRLSDSNVTMKSIWLKPATRHTLISYWLLVLGGLAYDEAIPLFLVATDGGLSLQEKTIGAILSGAGLFYGIFQYLTYSQITNRFGLFGALAIASSFGSSLAVLTPLSTFFNQGAVAGTLYPAAFFYLVILLGIFRINSVMYFASISLAANRTVTREEISAMNGLSMFGGSVAQAVGPFAAGSFTTFALSSGVFNPDVGVYFTFSVISFVGLCLAAMTLTYLRKHNANNAFTSS